MKAAIQIIISIVSNWRIDVLTLSYALVLALAITDSDDIMMFVVSKISAVIVGYLTLKLTIVWDKNGYLKELEIFNIDEENDEAER